MFKGVIHTGLIVSDLDEAVRFYCDVFGMRVKAELGVQTGPEVAVIMGLPKAQVDIVMLEKDGQTLELLQIMDPVPEAIHADTPYGQVGHAHLAFEVEDIDAAYQHLKDKGLDMVIPPQDIPEQKFFYLRDPNNQWVEVVEPQTV